MTKPNMFLRVLLAFILAGSIVFAGIAIYKFAKAETYRNTSDEIYTFSELTGISDNDLITRADYFYIDISKGIPDGGPYGRVWIDETKLQEITQNLLKMRFVETYEETEEFMLRLSIRLENGEQIEIYTYENTFGFGYMPNKKYRAIGSTYLYDLGKK